MCRIVLSFFIMMCVASRVKRGSWSVSGLRSPLITFAPLPKAMPLVWAALHSGTSFCKNPVPLIFQSLSRMACATRQSVRDPLFYLSTCQTFTANVNVSFRAYELQVGGEETINGTYFLLRSYCLITVPFLLIPQFMAALFWLSCFLR